MQKDTTFSHNSTKPVVVCSALVTEFKKALKERFSKDDLSFLYQKLFFGIFISEKDLHEILEYYRTVFLEEPTDWFRQFHKSIRQTDFFQGSYVKFVDSLTEEEIKRRSEILDIRSKFRRANKDEEPPHTQELRNLNAMMNKQEEVPIAGIADAFLYSLIHVDEKSELKKAMEVAFKICS